MNHRERVLTALNHGEPDRVPVDCGGRQTTLMIETYENLKNKLGYHNIPTKLMSKVWQTVYVDESILERFSIDCRHIRPANKAPQTQSLIDTPSSDAATNKEDIFVDQWGVTRKIEGGYASIIEHPLQEATLEDLEGYAWPDPEEDYDFHGLNDLARELYDEKEFAIVGCMGSPGNLFEQSWYLRGLSEFLMDLMVNKDFAHSLLSKILEIRKKNAKLFLREVGDYLDVFQLADDLAMQNGPLMSPELYREMIKPYQIELFQFVRNLTKAKIYFHSCGSVAKLLDDLIDVGVQILNPVQVSANGMETDQLKRRFGKKLSFWGAIDTFKILPKGSIQDVQHEVKKTICDLAPGGGYVLAPVHNLQPDIPPENIIAMYQAASKYGSYPISHNYLNTG